MLTLQETIRPSADLRNHYSEISKLCKENKEAVIITVNGRGDTVVLSYEEYKNMKALIEGGLEVRPKNVLIYATSNRKNLIREGFNDRQGDEIHARETVEEKHSLAERFGVTLTFSVGNQNDYLNTVYKLAEIYNINLPKETLKREAIKWAALSSGRSNRVAKQFIMSVNSLV